MVCVLTAALIQDFVGGKLVYYLCAGVVLQGQVEADVEELGFERYSIYRPAYVTQSACNVYTPHYTTGMKRRRENRPQFSKCVWLQYTEWFGFYIEAVFQNGRTDVN